MKKFLSRLRRFFFPPDGTPMRFRILPYAILGVLTLVVLIAGAYGWEYTNSPEFCGAACHTMPPEYTAYLISPHARVDCVDCHIGEGFITTRITRKAGDAKHIIRLLFADYEYPITAHEMRPARETCEMCHFPEKFSDDSFREDKQFANDKHNTESTLYLIMKTGGGTKRLGLGQGIHWHIENQVLYYAEDHQEQEIPYIRVINDDGAVSEFMDIESSFDPSQVADDELHEMDCITCHNRISHLVNPPEEMLDEMLARGVISTDIPDIRRLAVEIFYREYQSKDTALNAISGISNYYRTYYSEFYDEQPELVDSAIDALLNAYDRSIFPEQKTDWKSHYNNIGHQYSPGCFRCHDGKHLNEKDEAIRLECNICHSIPVVANAVDFVTDIEISHGPEPKSHLNPNWITIHRDIFDQSCQNCHTVDDPGGVSNTSFCSNSACHGSVFTYAGFDAPALREILLTQLPPSSEAVVQESVPDESMDGSEALAPLPDPESIFEGAPTYENSIKEIFANRCTNCHGSDALAGLDLSTYATAMKGSQNAPVILPGDPENSLLINIVKQGHFSQFSPDELDIILNWVLDGAPEDE